MTVGIVLRDRRIQLGWSLAQVSSDTRIPIEHLEAIEDERWGDLPEGPYMQAYVKSYADHIGVKLVAKGQMAVDEDVPRITVPDHRYGYLLGGIAMAGVLLIGGIMWWQRPAAQEVATIELPDQHVRIVARRNTDLKVVVDGELVFDRRLSGGQELTVVGHDRVVVELPAAENARVDYNGETLVPQGRQDQPRRLVFVDDTEPAVILGLTPHREAP